MRTTPTFAWATFAATVLLCPSNALADFDQFQWTLKGHPAGSGTLSAKTMIVTSPDGLSCGPDGGKTYYETVAPVGGFVYAFLNFYNIDSPLWEKPISVVNGVATPIVCGDSCPSFSASFSFRVEAGDSFGLGAWALDCYKGSSVATYTEFRFVPHAATLNLGQLQVYKQASGGSFGASVDGAGDVNGDGVVDIVAGAPDAAVMGSAGAGYAHVVSGVDGTTLHSFNGSGSQAAMGHSVSGAGDVDGDGYADIAIGAPGTAGVGSAELRSGQSGQMIRSFVGAVPQEELGHGLDGQGDLDGDGVPDLLVGSPGASTTAAMAGQLQVFSGASGALLLQAQGTTASARLGASASYAGDANADGFLDIVGGAPDDLTGGFKLGAVYVYSGSECR